MARFSEEDGKSIWDMREAGVPVKRIAKHLGRQNSLLRKFIADAGGRRPTARGYTEMLAEPREGPALLVEPTAFSKIALGQDPVAGQLAGRLDMSPIVVR